MMGERTVVQEALLYSFNVERHVPEDHLLRSIDLLGDTFERSALTFDHDDDGYIWPAGKRLGQGPRVDSIDRQSVDQDGMLCYRISKLD